MRDPYGLPRPGMPAPVLLAPGVLGWTTIWPDGSLAVPFMVATTPGNGDGGRYLDGLPRDRRVVFPVVMSRTLAQMLERRGFRHEDRLEFSHVDGEWIEGWVRDPA